jgi:HlyD family secretion protein
MKTNLLLFVSLAVIIYGCNNDRKTSFAFGNFESEEIIVSSETSGTLKDFQVTEGMNLEAGQVLGVIDTIQLSLKKRQLEVGIKTVRSNISQLNGQLKANEVSLNNLIREKNRVEALLKDGAATTKQFDDIYGQIDLLRAQMDVLKSQMIAAYTEIESLNVQVDQVKDQISRSYVKSPISGIVLEKYQYAGELAMTGKALFKISNLDQLILRVFISGDQLEAIRLGKEVKVLVDAENGAQKEYPGTVSWVSSNAEFTPKIIQTRKERVNLVYAVKIIVPNDGGLKIGMPAEISVN